MNFWERFFSRKESLARTVTTMHQLGQSVSTPANYGAYAAQGFQKNVIVYQAISRIARAASGIRLVHYTGKKNNPKELMESPLLTLLNRPNPLQAGPAFIESVVAFYCLSGNSYIESNSGLVEGANGRVPLELWPVRPDKMTVVAGAKGYPKAYRFEANGQTREWPVDMVKLISPILHWKTFHPMNDWYGMSPLEAALLSLDQSNYGQRWNLALLQNSATPSGVLQMKVSDANPRGEMSELQYSRIKNEFERGFQGARNAGRPLILEGGLSWASIAMSPKDMDFAKQKEVTATDIALAFGVPPELMGLGQKTFNNYKEARGAFYEETVLPTLDSLIGELNRWLVPAFGEGDWLGYDADDVEALTYKREAKFAMLKDANYLTQNEKREAIGYDKAEGWDVFLIGNQLLSTPDDAMDPAADTNNPDDSANSDSENDKPEEDPKPSDPAPTEDVAPQPDEENAKGWKSFNLVNANEKRKSWIRQNNRRKSIAVNFEKELKQDFDSLTRKLAKESAGLKDPKLIEFALLKTVNAFMPRVEKTIEHHIGRTMNEFGSMILDEGKSLGFDKEVKANRRYESFAKDYTSTRSGEAIKTISSTTQKKIRKIVGEWVQTAIQDGDTVPELAKFIQSEFGELTSSQANRIARTEVAMASNAANREAVKSLQIPNMYKEWVTADDTRVRDGGDGNDADHTAMNGEAIPIDEKFTVPPDRSMDGPGDPAGGADQVINCRCVLTFKSKN